MISVFNVSRRLHFHYQKKNAFHQILKLKGIQNNKTIDQKIKQKIAITPHKKLFQKQSFSQKFSLSQQKVNNLYSCSKYLTSQNHSRFGVQKVGLNTLLQSRFSTEMQNTKRSFYMGGVFYETITCGTTFVDTSLFIKEIIQDTSKVILITMPQLWGKSFNLNMLGKFLSIEEQNLKKREQNKKIFTQKIKNTENGKTQLDISKSFILQKDTQNQQKMKQIKALQFQGKYPVISINLANCKGPTFKKVRYYLGKTITYTIQEFGYLAYSQKEFNSQMTIGQRYNKLLSESKSGFFSTALKELSRLLYYYHEQKVWLLIDQYDAAVNQAYLNFQSIYQAQTVAQLFSSFYHSTIINNKCLEKTVMVGILYLGESCLFLFSSRFNSFQRHNVTSQKYSKYFGVDQFEMNRLFKHFRVQDSKSQQKIKDWYYGYKQNRGSSEQPQIIEKYNIWSIAKYLSRQDDGFKPHWENSKLSSIITYNKLKNINLKKTIQNLVYNNNLGLGKLKEDFTIQDFKELKYLLGNHNQIYMTDNRIKLLFSFLYNAGYLTYDFKTNDYAIPNREIRQAFETELRVYYCNLFHNKYTQFLFSFIKQHLNNVFLKTIQQNILDIFINEIEPLFANIITNMQVATYSLQNLTLQQVINNQDLIQSMLNFIRNQFLYHQFKNQLYFTRPNKTKGRADVVIAKNGKAILMEIKYLFNTQASQKLIKKQANQALEQAKSYSQLVKNVQTKIFIGCVITSRQKVCFSYDIKTEENQPINNL